MGYFQLQATFLLLCATIMSVNQISVNFCCNSDRVSGSPRFHNRQPHEIIELVVPNKLCIELGSYTKGELRSVFNPFSTGNFEENLGKLRFCML